MFLMLLSNSFIADSIISEDASDHLMVSTVVTWIMQ